MVYRTPMTYEQYKAWTQRMWSNPLHMTILPTYSQYLEHFKNSHQKPHKPVKGPISNIIKPNKPKLMPNKPGEMHFDSILNIHPNIPNSSKPKPRLPKLIPTKKPSVVHTAVAISSQDRFSAMNPSLSPKPKITSPSEKIVKTFVKGGITYQIVGGKGIPKRMYKRENDTWKLIPVKTLTVPRHAYFIKPRVKAIESVTVLNSPFAIPPTVLNKKTIKIK